VVNRGDVEFALNYIEKGSFDTVPETIHEKAFHLLRLLVANHPFVDANKRTALNTAVVFYFLNGYRFEYDDEIRSILKQSEQTKRPSMKRRLSSISRLRQRNWT
jgi:death-on-curing protein